MSAYACGPELGSEPGTGWAWARAAAVDHDVWLLTRTRNRESITAALDLEPNLRLTPIYLDLPTWVLRLKRGRWVRTYYSIWQSLARREAKRLHSVHQFDVAHHITFGTDWLPAGVVGIRALPSVWGPVGGTAPFPWALREWLGVRGLIEEALRVPIGWVGRRIFGDWAARRATLVIAQNHEVASRFDYARPILEPHVALEPRRAAPPDDAHGNRSSDRTALFVGRLLAWKGILLAVRTIAETPASNWRLEIFGEGPQSSAARRLADRLRISDRVTFNGQRDRLEVLAAYRSADAMLFPSMHDSASWAVGEAIMSGLRVICLDVCGPAVLVERTNCGRVVPISRSAPHALAEALQSIEAVGPQSLTVEPVSSSRLPSLLSSWYNEATRAEVGGVE